MAPPSARHTILSDIDAHDSDIDAHDKETRRPEDRRRDAKGQPKQI
jgi:hypothetical protein